MSSKTFKHDLFNQFARVGKALSHANRLELLEFLAQGERSVDTLAKRSGLSVANTSQHLQHLRQAGLVHARKQGLKVFYSLSGNDVIDLLLALRKVAERNLADVEQLVQRYLQSKDKLEPIARDVLLERVRDGAVNVPLEHLADYLDGLDTNQDIVAYCRGPHCVLAFDAVQAIREKGFTAHRLQDGYPEWKAAGLPVETGNTSAGSPAPDSRD